MRKQPWPGTWLAVCDVCGFEFPSNEIKDRWDGLKVCSKDWEVKHPQLYIRAPRESIVPPWVRPEPADVFVQFCTLAQSIAVPGLATPGCMTPGLFYNLPD
jgi:hypothetical protein